MDPLSHAVLGRLSTAALRRGDAAERGVAAASVLGALAPDGDVLLVPFGWDIYLRVHQIGTHTIAGAALTGIAAAAVVRACVRRSRVRPLLASSLIGAASHVAADVASGGRLRLAWPLWDAIVSMPIVAMADPWPIAILAAGAIAYWRRRADRVAVARAVLLALMLFLAAKTVLFVRALDRFDSSVVDSSGRIEEARWGSLTDWLVFDRGRGEIRQWRVPALGGPLELVLSWPEGAGSALVDASRQLDTVRNFLYAHALGFAVERPAGGDRRAVLWSDIRFCWKPPPGGEPIACALWFGGIVDRTGRVLSQQVRVGAWVQDRPPPVSRVTRPR
jgi:membrane-bound metal-dependent hydrolase YbcI (DUF457 family)